ncbi:MAG TPA: 50S ribosomal protein L25 [Proteobacteria bacterium]|nr:50S ribosomal protein L25 [Pseudomonadota bacterium]
MAQLTLEVKVRSEIGGGRPRMLRREGLLPGVFYSRGEEPIPLTLNLEYIRKATGRLRENQIVSLEIDRDGKKFKKPAIVKEIQVDYLANALLHIDFQQIALDEKLTAMVPLISIGESIGVTRDGGILEHILREVEIECLPTDLPESIEVDVSELTVGATIHVSDITAIEGVEILTEPTLSIFALAAPITEEEVAPEEIEEEEAAAEGEGEGEEGEDAKTEG